MTDNTTPEITPELIAEHGLTPEEYQRVEAILGRAPNHVELGIFSVMWSEHCSYKSSKTWLKQLPTEGPRVVQGPGENAGVVDIGDGQVAIFKIESHNHPSYIEPKQGAATGVGGILRDVFTMGARPVCLLNALRFGDPADARTRRLLDGVVRGIGGYANCVGIPTIAGEVGFHRANNANNLVNAMCVGVAERDTVHYATAAGTGNPVVYVGARTGRDGIHGATMASSSFEADSGEDQRPTVQVGDPFTEKLLIEACLELMATDAVVGIQDMGAAGLTSSSFEMASKAGTGIELDLDHVPRRETGMNAYEIMLSESQERMLMILRPGWEDTARAIFEKWDLEMAVVGRVTDTGRMVIHHDGERAADLPIDPLAEEAPEYQRPWQATPAQAVVHADDVPAPADAADALKRLMACPDLASKRWVWEQYDHMVGADTVQRPGGDAGVVRVHGTSKGLAVTTDCTPRYVEADPVEGGKQAVAESWRNLAAVGAEPLAMTDNMNFGNPEKPRIMGQFAGAVEGMRQACSALAYPVVSGNVSLYNETGDTAVQPTPTVGGVGLLPELSAMARAAFPREDETIVLLGATEGHLGASLYLRELCGREDGAPPPVDLDAERRAGELARRLIAEGSVSACHDVSDGGLAAAVAEMALAGNVGAEMARPQGAKGPNHAWLYGEDQGRYCVTTAAPDAVRETAAAAGVPAAVVGRTGGYALKLPAGETMSLEELRAAHEGWLPAWMAGEA